MLRKAASPPVSKHARRVGACFETRLPALLSMTIAEGVDGYQVVRGPRAMNSLHTVFGIQTASRSDRAVTGSSPCTATR